MVIYSEVRPARLSNMPDGNDVMRFPVREREATEGVARKK